jgi:SAM-dependent methyltransferase
MDKHSYLLDNAWQQGRARLDAVEQFLDSGTVRTLEALEVAAGWRCLEVGAGGGSIALWLSQRVGASGNVIATDVDTRHLDALDKADNLEVLRHDIVHDSLDGDFDLIHARLLLEHIPERDLVLSKLVHALAPAGWLVIEALDYASAVAVSERGAQEHTHSQRVRLREFARAGIRTDYGRHLPRLMRASGLVEVRHEGRVFIMEGGSAGARWFKLSMEQLQPKLRGPDKLSGAEIDRMLELFDDPSWAALSPIIFACWGRRSVD